MAHLVFFEVQDWERELYTKTFPDAQLVHTALSATNASEYAQAEIVSTFIRSDLSKETMQQLPNLRGIATRSTGFDHIDVAYAKSRSIRVCNVPEYGSNTVAEHTFALILTLTRRILPSVLQLRNPDFQHTDITGMDLAGKTIGIVGLGKIGLRVVRMARGFGMNVLVCNRTHRSGLDKEEGFTYTELDELLKVSDIVSLHLAHSPETHHIINTSNVSQMKKGSYLINTARGPLIQTEAIMYGLQTGILSGVGLDVLEQEKDVTDEVVMMYPELHQDEELKALLQNYILLRHPRVVITPHNAFNSHEALDRIAHTSVANVNGLLSSKPINVVGT